jgi:flavin-dependent dehydrogenase
MRSNHRIHRHRHDVVVVGGRAAGAATALLLGRLGHDVVLVERDEFPSDTISTHQIARPGVVQLSRWGLLPAVLDSGAPAIRQFTFTALGESTTRVVKDKAGVDLLVAPRRYVLDSILADAAARAGVRVRHGVRVEGVAVDGTGRATGVYGRDRTGRRLEIDARFVVGADGVRSVVARAVDAVVLDDRGADGATLYSYYTGPAWRAIELIVGERALAGVFPTHDGAACIWITTPTVEARRARRQAASRLDAFTTMLERAAPDLSARLRTARRTAPVTGMLRTPNVLRQAHGRGWALVGDAGYHHDAVTGYGLSDAFRDAELLAVALDRALHAGAADDHLAGYQRDRDDAVREIFDLTCAMAGYPGPAEFVELQKRLSQAIDREAAALASRPVPGERTLAGV